MTQIKASPSGDDKTPRKTSLQITNSRIKYDNTVIDQLPENYENLAEMRVNIEFFVLRVLLS